uniref:Wu:fc23c09 n=1 Tax=Scleropages formosus TaxID=113540 RepID=A0A8C9QVZ7_SCLFO
SRPLLGSPVAMDHMLSPLYASITVIAETIGSKGLVTVEETENNEDRISDKEGLETREVVKKTKKGDKVDGTQETGNEETLKKDGEEEVRNEEGHRVKDKQVNRVDSEEPEAQKIRQSTTHKYEVIVNILPPGNKSVTHIAGRKPPLPVEDRTATQTIQSSTLVPADFTLSRSPLKKHKNITHNTSSEPTWILTMTDSPHQRPKNQKGPVSMEMKIRVDSDAVVSRNVITNSQKQRSVGQRTNHEMSRSQKKVKPATNTHTGKKTKAQKKGNSRAENKPEKKDTRKKKAEKMSARFPYFKDDYCPPECACYGRVVQCSDKGVDKIPYGIPYNTRYLLLMNNQIDGIQLDLLKEYLSLEFLVLTNNHLTDGSVEGAFEDMRQLKRLFLDRNWLGSVPTGLPASLEELRLDGNNVSVMSEASWSCCPALHLLTLANNSLGEESIPSGAFSPLVSLHTLTLSHNHLSSTPLRLPRQLRELYLHGNRIEQVPGGVFPVGSALLSLDLSANRLPDAGLQRDSFQHAHMLESLNLEGNLLRSVPRHLPTSLRTLNLEGNLISTIGKRAFQGLLHLEHLGLSRNHISQVAPGAFRWLAALHQLDLSHNDLLEVPRNIPPNLHSVLLNHNRISFIPQDAFCAGGRTAAPSSLVRVQLECNVINMQDLDSHALWCLRGFQVVHFY